MNVRLGRFRAVALMGAAALALGACGGETPDAAPSEEESAGDAEGDDTGEQGDAVDKDETADAEANEAQKAANLESAKAFLAENAKRDGVVTTESGLQYEIVSKGPEDGASPEASDLVDVHYVGTLTNGEEFDSSRARGQPARFPLNRVIPGWTEAVQLMSEGDRFKIFLPPELAYGETGTPNGPIGPNEALVFDVELIKVASPKRNLAKAKEFLAENKAKDGIQTTESGLQYEVLTEGGTDGVAPEATNVVRVHYEGRLIDGTVFDSSLQRGTPAEFPLNRVIAGWTEGLQLMSEGDKYRFYIPPELGYGETGAPGGSIGPNEALVFEVELLEVKG